MVFGHQKSDKNQFLTKIFHYHCFWQEYEEEVRSLTTADTLVPVNMQCNTFNRPKMDLDYYYEIWYAVII